MVGYVIKNEKGEHLYRDSSNRLEVYDGDINECTDKYIFTHQKVWNIMGCLPKKHRDRGFEVKEITIDDVYKQDEENILINENYVVPYSVTAWVDKFDTCYKILNSANKRIDEINTKLSELEREFMDITHEIEMSDMQNVDKGYDLYIKIRDNRVKRRELKDEQTILCNIIPNAISKINDMEALSSERVERAIKGLTCRKYNIRNKIERE